LGQALAKHHWATAMIDVSDGLLMDTSHLLQESGVGVRVWEDRIPLSKLYQKWIHSFSKDPFQLALSGGEDYELLFTSSPKMRERISSLARSLKIPITRIGEILPIKEGLHIVKRNGKDYSPSRLGFDHFR
jgi:thiamine-monophosphate kinase